MQIRRRRITFFWILANIIPITLAAVASMYLSPEGFIYPPEVDTSLFTDFDDVIQMMPLGWLLNFVLPTGWISLLCFAIALWKRSLKPLIAVVIVCLIYGLFWPHWFQGFMGI